LQQSVATAHELPDPEQVATDELHVCATGSQAFEQQAPFAVQAAPATVHTKFAPPVPGDPLVPPPPPGLAEFPQPEIASASARAPKEAKIAGRRVAHEDVEVRVGLIVG
jgi:hypothetical protein